MPSTATNAIGEPGTTVLSLRLGDSSTADEPRQNGVTREPELTPDPVRTGKLATSHRPVDRLTVHAQQRCHLFGCHHRREGAAFYSLRAGRAGPPYN